MNKLVTAAALAALLFTACKKQAPEPTFAPPNDHGGVVIGHPPVPCWECTVEEFIPFWNDSTWCGTRELVTICDKDSAAIARMCDSMKVDNPTYKRKVWCYR